MECLATVKELRIATQNAIFERELKTDEELLDEWYRALPKEGLRMIKAAVSKGLWCVDLYLPFQPDQQAGNKVFLERLNTRGSFLKKLEESFPGCKFAFVEEEIEDRDSPYYVLEISWKKRKLEIYTAHAES